MKKLLFILFCVIFRGTGLAETLPWTETARTDGQLKGIKALSDGSIAFFGEISKEMNSNATIQNVGLLKPNGSVSQLGNGLPAGVNDICQMANGDIYAVGKFFGGVAKLSTGNTTWQLLTLTSNDPLGFKFVEAINANELLIGMEGDTVNGIKTGTVFIYNTVTKAITPKPVNGWPSRFHKNGNTVAITYWRPFGDGKNLAVLDCATSDWNISATDNIMPTVTLDGVTSSTSALYVYGVDVSDYKIKIWSYTYANGTWQQIALLNQDIFAINFSGSKLYATGMTITKVNGSSNYDPGWSYDEGSKTWESSNMSMPAGVSHMVKTNTGLYIGNIDGYIYRTSIATGLVTTPAQKFGIFPNPARETAYITSPNTLSTPLFAINGQIIRNLQLEKGENLIDLDIAPGTYFVGQTKLVVLE